MLQIKDHKGNPVGTDGDDQRRAPALFHRRTADADQGQRGGAASAKLAWAIFMTIATEDKNVSEERNGTPLLSLRGISKAYPGVQALSGVSLDLYPGKGHALVGENGAGKSTLIKVIAGLVHADEGEILLNGEPTHVRTPAEADGKYQSGSAGNFSGG